MEGPSGKPRPALPLFGDMPGELLLRALPLRLELRFVEERSLPPGCVRLVDHRPAADRVTLMHPPAEAGSAEAGRVRDAALRGVLSVVRREAEAALPPLVAETARRIGAPVPPRVRIGMPRTRWASRSSTGTVSCNLLLVFLPGALVLHVVLHELAHVYHMDHGPQFRALLSRLDPLGSAHEKALKSAPRNYIPAPLRGL